MNELDQEIKTLLVTLFDPNSKTKDLQDVLAQFNQMLVDQDVMNKGNLPKNKDSACIYLASQSADTSAKDLEYLISKYYKSIEVAKLVARHPNLPIHWLARMMLFLPEDARANPKFDTYSQDDRWEKLLEDKPKSAKSRYKYSMGGAFDYIVDHDRPDYFKLNYWFKNGKAADRIYLVSIPKISEDLLHGFTNDSSAHVRKALANRKRISEELALALVNDKAKTVRQTLANNPNCSPQVLAQLTQDREAIVKAAALANKACPVDAIHAAKLAEQMKPKAVAKPATEMSEQEIISQLASDTLDEDTIKAFSRMSQPFLRAAVALHKSSDQKILSKLAKDKDQMVRLSVAYNPNTPVSSLQQLLKLAEPELYPGLAANPSLPEKQQLALIKVADEASLLTLANTTESTLVWEALRDSEPPKAEAQKKDNKKKTWRECLEICLDAKGKGLYALQRNRHTRHLFVNKLIARHPKCTESLKGPYAFYLLESLMKNPQLALAMLENPNAVKPEEYAEWKLKDWFMYEDAPGHVVKYYLNSDQIKYARKAVICWTAQLVDIQAQIYNDDIHMKKYMAGLPHATQFMLEILARDPKESVRMAVLDNKNTPTKVLMHLTTDKVAGIRTAAQSHKNFDAKMMPEGVEVKVESLKNKGAKRIRIKQAKDTESLTVLRDLAGDKLAEVRLNVIKNKKCPIDVLELLKTDEVAEIRGCATDHPNSSIDIRKHLLSDKDDRVRMSALRNYMYATAKKPKLAKGEKRDYRNRVFDEEMLGQFKDDPYEPIRALVARLTINTEVQSQLATDESSRVRESVAENYHLEPKLAHALIKAGDPRVVSLLAENTIDQDVFLATLVHADVVASSLWRNDQMRDRLSIHKVLIKHKNPKIRQVVADYATDPEILSKCAEDGATEVVETLAYNENLKVNHIKQILAKATESIMSNLCSSNEGYLKKYANELSVHPNKWVRAYIASNFKVSAVCLEKLAADKEAVVRDGLADGYINKLSEKLIEQLRNDPNETVRKHIQWRYD